MEWWFLDKGKNPESNKLLTVLYPNVEAFKWFKDHPYIWLRGEHAEITGADYNKVQAVFTLEMVNQSTQKKIFERFKHIERGVVEASLVHVINRKNVKNGA